MIKKRRGRPPKPETTKKREIKEAEDQLMACRPSRLTTSKLAASTNWGDLLVKMEVTRKKILKEFKTRWAPEQHAYEMASLGNEWFEGKNAFHAEKILSRDNSYKSKAKRIRDKSGGTNISKARSRGERVLLINQVLVEKIGNSPVYKPHTVAKKIHCQWQTMSDAQRLMGEPVTMTSRGDGGPTVSIRTIERWLEKYTSIIVKPGRLKNPQK